MDGMLREQRRTELLNLWKSNPHRVLSLYRELADLDELAPLPAGATSDELIDGILEKSASVDAFFILPP